MTSPVTVLAALSDTVAASGRRLVLVLVTLAMALGVVAAPALTDSASAATSGRAAHPWAYSMLDLLNAERRAHHLRPLTMNTRLVHSAYYHNLRMARRNAMSHQLSGEAFFATRISNQGYRWRNAGENIGWTGRISIRGLRAMESAMYHEKAPNDGHRQNILSRSFTQVGIQVRYDARHHKIWYTQDFGRPIG